MNDNLIDRTSHSDIISNPDVNRFLSQCNYMSVPTGRELDDIISNFLSVPSTNIVLPEHIIAIDGNDYEASVREELPHTRVGFVKISNLLINRKAYKAINTGKFVDPFEIARLNEDNTSISFSFPSTNILYKGEDNVRDSFRLALDEALYNCRFDDDDPKTSLRSTLFLLSSYRTGKMKSDSRDKLILFSCPNKHCSAEYLEVYDIPERQKCPVCGKPIYPSDCLRIWEEVDDFASNKSALTRFTNVIKHIFVVHYIRHLQEKSKNSYVDVLSNLCFFIDGPLAIFGNAAWVHASIMKYMYEINTKMAKFNKEAVIVLGLLRNGSICDYLNLIQDKIPNNSIFCIDDQFRSKYINFDKIPSSTTFGAETYYGQDFMLKTATGRTFVFDALFPFQDKQDKSKFRTEKADIKNYLNIGAYIKLIEDFECDLYSNTVVPIALSQKYTTISLEPGGKVLDILVQDKMGR